MNTCSTCKFWTRNTGEVYHLQFGSCQNWKLDYVSSLTQRKTMISSFIGTLKATAAALKPARTSVASITPQLKTLKLINS